MKKTLLLLSTIIISYVSYAQTYFDQDFSTFVDSITPPSGWANIDSIQPSNNQIWRFDNPGTRTLNSPITQPAAIIDASWYGLGTVQDAYLTTPSFDASAAPIVRLEFDHVYVHRFGGTAEVQIFNGTNWVTDTVFTNGTDFTGLLLSTHERLDISDHVAGIPNAKIRFRYTTALANGGRFWILDFR